MDRFQNTRQPDWDWWSRLWPTPGDTLRRLGVAAGTSLVEVGCGNGYFTLPAARITDPAPVFALDVDESLLEESAHLADRQNITNVELLHGDARSLSQHLPDPVDVVLLANAFHGVENPEPLVQQAFESLHPGGRFVVVNWHDLPREETTVMGSSRGPPTELRLTPAETENIVLDASEFDTTRHVELPPYHYGILFER